MNEATTNTADLAALANIDNQEYEGFKIGDLRAAFCAIQNTENWKFQIKARVPKAEFGKFNAAAIFFAGSPLKVTADWTDGTVSVYGAGYYNCIGA
jgi:hypothetical protein